MVRDKFDFNSIPKGNGKWEKSQTIPDQSMSIHELVRRFVRGIPADVIQRKPVFNPDNNDVDLERLGRLDPADKAFQASEMFAQNKATASELQRTIDDRRRRAEESEKAEADQGEQQTGIESLDNTMPDDTDVTPRNLGGKKTKSKNQ